MKRVVLFSLLLTMVLLAGCTNKRVAYQDVDAQKGMAVLYVYRPSSFINSAETMTLYVNDKEIDFLANGGYRYAMVEPGEANIVLKKNIFPYTEYGSIVVKDLKAGESYYIKADPIPMGGFSMILMDKATGRQEASAAGFYIPQ